MKGLPLAQNIAIYALLAIAAYLPMIGGRLVACMGAAMAIGGIVSGALTNVGLLTPVAALIPGAFAGAMLLVGVGEAFKHLTGLQFSIASLSVGEVLRLVVTNTPNLGDATGFSVVTPHGQPWLPFFVLSLVLGPLVLFEMGLVRHRLFQLASDPEAARAYGTNVAQLQRQLMFWSGFIAGTAGAVYAHTIGLLEPELWGFQHSLRILLFAILGGAGHVIGPVLGTVMLMYGFELLRISSSFRVGFYGSALVLAAALLPNGLVAYRPKRLAYLLRRFFQQRWSGTPV